MSSMRQVGADVEIRLVLLADQATGGVITGPFGGVSTMDLAGGELASEHADGEFKFELAPWEIRTLRLTPTR
ncbi:hypothetical protein NG819_04695 [Pseudarthrobacter sp. Fe7]|nr:hypothetical protein NG819_04695 [Pseudarthrobacter sp. Fe7]